MVGGRCNIQTLKNVSDWVGRVTAFSAAAILSVSVVVVFLQVVFRYFLGLPLAWAEESARFLFIWVSLLGASLGVKDHSHFAITLITDQFPAVLQPAVRLLIALGGSFIFYIMITEGWMLTLMNRNQESPAMGVVMTIPYMVIPLSGLLMLFFTWADYIMHARGFDPHDHEELAELTSQEGF